MHEIDLVSDVLSLSEAEATDSPPKLCVAMIGSGLQEF